jgi:hypothetical protein
MAYAPGATLVHQPREQPVAEVLEAVLTGVLGELLQHGEHALRLEHEDLVGHDVGRGLVRLVRVVGDAVAVHLHHAVPARVLGIDLGGHHRDRGAALQVLVDDLGVVEPVDRVGTHDDQRVGVVLPNQVGVAPQRVGGALVPARPVAAEPRMQRQQAAGRSVEVPRPAVGQVVGQ